MIPISVVDGFHRPTYNWGPRLYPGLEPQLVYDTYTFNYSIHGLVSGTPIPRQNIKVTWELHASNK